VVRRAVRSDHEEIGGYVYQKPKLERFGTFRELTLYGVSAPDCDGGSILGIGGSLKGCPVVEPQTFEGGGAGGGS